MTAPFLCDSDLPLSQVLPESEVKRVFAEEQVTFGQSSRSIWTPALTLWAFLSQVISKEKSCRAAVWRVVVTLGLKWDADDVNTGNYCRARAKLSERALERLCVESGRRLEDAALPVWRWLGKSAFLLDGTTITMPDTAANQEVYPQSRSQPAGLGFPQARLVWLLGLATAACVGLAVGPRAGKETGETALFRQLLDRLRPDDVVVADRYYCSYWMVAEARRRGFQVVLRMHQRRRYDFRCGQRLGHDDHLVFWCRPARPDWMSEAEYAQVPELLVVRELRVRVAEAGFRVRELVIVSTLTDAEAVSAEDLAELYRQRWQVELDTRAIKRTLGMEPLRCTSPEMVRKEIWAHVLAYNLTRKVAAQAALGSEGTTPRQISLASTQQALAAGWDRLSCGDSSERSSCVQKLLKGVASQIVGDRPNRCEPRAVKRRSHAMALLKVPRAEAREQLRRGRKKKAA